MPINSYFNHTTRASEQSLLQDLIDESISIYGHETYYIQRENVNLDLILGEDDLSRYANAMPIEMYIKSSTSFAGQGDFISKFGLHIEDQCTFSVSRRRFETVMGSTSRPRGNDLIWLKLQEAPFAQCPLFEIRFVEQKEQLFQLGKLYTYEIRCELMQFSHERIQTANTEINATAQGDAYTLDISLGAGTGTYIIGEPVYQGNTFLSATATATVYAWNSTTKTLSVQNITGAFASNTSVVGITSNADYVSLSAPDTAANVRDAIADNIRTRDEAEDVIIVRGSNPRKT